MQFDQLKRRRFITLLGGAAGWPLAARAQQMDRIRRIGVLMSTAADDLEGQARIAAFLQGLQGSNGSGGPPGERNGMDAHEIVIHGMKRDGTSVVLDLL